VTVSPSADVHAVDTAQADRYLRGAVAIMTLSAAAIHFAMAPDHFGEYWLFGAFFVASGWVQIGLAAAVVARPGRRLYWFGLAVQSLIVALWIVTRTSGLPVGPEHWEAEAVAAVDSICSGFEVATALGFAVLLVTRVRTRQLAREYGAAFVGGVLVVALGLTAFALTPTGLGAESSGDTHGMAGMSMGAGQHPDHPEVAAAVKTGGAMDMEGMSVPTLGPGSGVLAGAAVPGCLMKHMKMVGHAVGACTDAPLTSSQVAAASSLVVRTRAALVKFPTLTSAYAAGYKDANVSGALIHVTNYAYLTDDKVLDPDAIESLVYFKAPSGDSLLLGAMYVADGDKPGPLVGGALTSWHSHTNLCVDPRAGTALNKRPDGTCAPGSSVGPTGQMLHVWAVPYDGGPFAEIEGPALIKAITGAVKARGGLAALS
jgi:hypothetical protein